MTPLALTLHLMAAEPALASRLELGPSLTAMLVQDVADDATIPSGPTDGELVAPAARPGVRVVSVAATSAGMLVGDLASGVLLLAAFGGYGADVAIAGTAVGTFLLLPPITGLAGARLAGESGDAAGRAYAIAVLARLATMGGASLLGPAGPVVFAATELVAVPYVIVRILANAPPRQQRLASPAVDARPVQDPVIAAQPFAGL